MGKYVTSYYIMLFMGIIVFFKTIVSLQICPNWVDCKYVAQGSSLCPSVIFHANQMEEKTLFPIISLFLSLPAFPNTLLGN